MDLVLLDASIDCYKRARKLVFDKDYELEAQSEAHLGNIYYRGLTNNKKARPHLYDAIRLAKLLTKNVTQQDWFLRATEQLQKVQEADQKAAEAKEAADEAKLKELIKKELEDCKKARDKDLRSLLNHLNQTVLEDDQVEVNDETYEIERRKILILRFQ